MTREVVAIPLEISLRAAARLLSQARIGGAPVIDARGRCVGVLSETDFVRRAREEGRAGPPGGPRPAYVSDWHLMDQQAESKDQVRRYMSADAVTAAPDTPVGDLVGMMLDRRVRRVIIVDEQRRPLGIVSWTDILGAVACPDHEAATPGLGGQLPAHWPGPPREPGNRFDRQRARRTWPETSAKGYDP
jgi:CBS domain-containing protein